MSTAVPPVAKPPVSPAPKPAPKPSPAERLIKDRVEEARRALWWSEVTRSVLSLVIGSMAASLLWLVVDHWIYSPGLVVRLCCFLAAIAAVLWYAVRRIWPVLNAHVTDEYAAWALEQDHPEYRQQLTSYVTLKSDHAASGIRARVVRAIGSKAASLLKSNDALPDEATGTFRWWIVAAATFALLAAYCVLSPKSSLASAKRLAAPLASIDPAKRVQIRDVLPGDSEALAGRDVAISAEIDGLRDHEVVICRWDSEGRTQQSELALETDSRRFVGTIRLGHSASGAVDYSIEAGDAVAGPFRLDVQNVPVVAIESIQIDPPGYTNLKPRRTTSPAIEAIDGTRVRFQARTNRAVERAELQFNPKQIGDTVRATGGRIPMSINGDGSTLAAEVRLRSAQAKTASVEWESYRVVVWDSSERSNPDPIVYPIKIIPDLPPEVTIVVPKKSPIEIPIGGQQAIEVHAMDADFELRRVSLKIERGIDVLQTPTIWVLPEEGNGKGNQVSEYRFRPLEHGLRVGDVVRVSAVAVDNRDIPDDPTVKPNVTTTDPIEIRIVENDEELPEDPTVNDGLTKPDDRPASDVDQSGQSGEQSGQSGEQSGQSGEQSGQSGEQSGQSGEQSGQSGEQSGQSGEQSGQSGEQSGQSGEQSGQSVEQSGQSGEQSGQSGEQSGQMGNQPDQQSNQPAAGDQQSGGESSESSQSPEGGDPNRPPSHDGEAMERIKDYIERKRQTGESQQQTGESQQQTGESQQQTGESQQQTGESQQQTGESQQQTGESQQQTGESQQQTGESQQQTGESQQQTGESQQQTGESQQQTGESQPDGSAAGQEEPGGQERNDQGDSNSEMESGQDTSSGQTGSEGEPSGSENASPQPEETGSESQSRNDDGTGETESGTDRSASSTESGDSSSDTGQRGDPDSSDAQPPNGSNEAAEGGDPTSDQQPPGSDPQSSPTDRQSSNHSPTPSSSGDGDGSGTPPQAVGGNDDPPPPPDLDYAKEATDMVLDYLDETRDQVDENLLDELGWSEQDLQRFRERWNKVRDLDQPTAPAEQSDAFRDALRSLGLTPKQTPARSDGGTADSLRDLQDSGNRRKAPPAIRDVFDAFRRRR